MVCIQEVEGERGPGSVKRSRIPPHSKQLAVGFYPSRTLHTSTKLDVDTMCAAEVNDENFVEAGARGWAWHIVMTDMEGVAELEECCSLVESVGPHL